MELAIAILGLAALALFANRSTAGGGGGPGPGPQQPHSPAPTPQQQGSGGASWAGVVTSGVAAAAAVGGAVKAAVGLFGGGTAATATATGGAGAEAAVAGSEVAADVAAAEGASWATGVVAIAVVVSIWVSCFVGATLKERYLDKFLRETGGTGNGPDAVKSRYNIRQVGTEHEILTDLIDGSAFGRGPHPYAMDFNRNGPRLQGIWDFYFWQNISVPPPAGLKFSTFTEARLWPLAKGPFQNEVRRSLMTLCRALAIERLWAFNYAVNAYFEKNRLVRDRFANQTPSQLGYAITDTEFWAWADNWIRSAGLDWAGYGANADLTGIGGYDDLVSRASQFCSLIGVSYNALASYQQYMGRILAVSKCADEEYVFGWPGDVDFAVEVARRCEVPFYNATGTDGRICLFDGDHQKNSDGSAIDQGGYGWGLDVVASRDAGGFPVFKRCHL